MQRGAMTVLVVIGLLLGVGLPQGRSAPARRLVVYSAAPQAFTESLKHDFEVENPGVTVEILAGLGGEAMIARLDAERSSPRADVMHSGAVFEFLEAGKKGLLGSTRPREIAGVFPASLFLGGSRIPLFDTDGRWYVWGFSLGVIGFNRDRLAALRLPVPKTWSDLANPIYKGQVVFNMPQLSSSAFNTIVALYQIMGPQGLWSYWDRVNDNVAFYSRSTAALYTLVGRGEIPISFGVARPYYEGQARGQAVDVVYPSEGAWVFATAVGMVNNAPNPDLAKTFMKFILSSSGQVQAVNQFQNPVRAGIRPTAHSLDLSIDAVVRQVPKIIVVGVEVAEAEFFSLLGPSGCGKTTTLRMVAGLERPTRGEVWFGDDDVTTVPPQHRNVGLVFQSYAVFPTMTVYDNVAYGLRIRRLPRDEIHRRVERVLEVLELGALAARMPGQLSGGQLQRVALARALAIQPRVLLLDEPLSNLDAKLRVDVRAEIKRLQRDLGITTLYVSHDQEEALSISDRVGVMNRGVLEQVGRPEAIYRRPATRFVAAFVGEGTLVEGRLVMDGGRGRVMIEPRLELAVPDAAAVPQGRVWVCIRPEALSLARDAAPDAARDAVTLEGTVEHVEFVGAVLRANIRVAGLSRPLRFSASSMDAGGGALRLGAVVRVEVNPAGVAIGPLDEGGGDGVAGSLSHT